MRPKTREQMYQSMVYAIYFLIPLGWDHVTKMIFKKDGVYYDLSAADITMHDHIVSNGIFVVDKSQITI